MTNAYITENRIFVKGHANYGTYGKDIVCAGVSTLCYMLLQYGLELFELGELTVFEGTDNPGDVEIFAEGTSEKWKTAVEVFTIGIKNLSEQFPDNVVLKVGM